MRDRREIRKTIDSYTLDSKDGEVYETPEVEIIIDMAPGDNKRALSLLESAVADVRHALQEGTKS